MHARPRHLGLFVSLMISALSASALPVHFGTYSPELQVADFDPATGALGGLRGAAALTNASFLATSPDGRFLYAVAEGKPGGLFAFARAKDGALTPLNQAPSEGGGPCDIAVSPDGALVAAANYGGGSAIVYRLREDGSIGEKAGFFQHTHFADVFPGRQKKPHAHGVTWSPDGKLLLVPDLGGDRVYVYSRDFATGAMAVHA
ncbi:MAG: lactonase family protein, partial [Opitutaceae bacterium]|nr:lactonase family protein [Opitutaceae bacterium]